jgi:hypothetical protein
MWSSANTHGYRDNYAHAYGYGYRDTARRRGPNGNTHANTTQYANGDQYRDAYQHTDDYIHTDG